MSRVMFVLCVTLSCCDAGIPFVTVDSRPSKQQYFNPGPTDFYLYPSESDTTAGLLLDLT
jgi:hypothetical protein